MPPNNDDTDFVEKMANYAIHYEEVFKTHVVNVCGRISSFSIMYASAENLPSVLDFKRQYLWPQKPEGDLKDYKQFLERICEESAVTPEEHSRICSAARALLTIQKHEMKSVGLDISSRVTQRIAEIRSDQQPTSTAGSSHSRSPVSEYSSSVQSTTGTKPPTRPLDEHDVARFMEDPTSLFSHTFVLHSTSGIRNSRVHPTGWHLGNRSNGSDVVEVDDAKDRV